MITLAIGLDVHKISAIAGVMDENELIISQKNTSNDIPVLDEFLKSYGENDIFMESTISDRYTSKELIKLNYRICLINRCKPQFKFTHFRQF